MSEQVNMSASCRRTWRTGFETWRRSTRCWTCPSCSPSRKGGRSSTPTTVSSGAGTSTLGNNFYNFLFWSDYSRCHKSRFTDFLSVQDSWIPLHILAPFLTNINSVCNTYTLYLSEQIDTLVNNSTSSDLYVLIQQFARLHKHELLYTGSR